MMMFQKQALCKSLHSIPRFIIWKRRSELITVRDLFRTRDNLWPPKTICCNTSYIQTSYHRCENYNYTKLINRLSTSIHSSQLTPIDEEINDTNHRYRNKVVVQSTNDLGWGVYASKTFHKGDIVFTMKALKSYTKRQSHTAQVDWDKHVTIDLPGRFINHSCDANCGILDNAHSGAYDVIALKTIESGEDLSIDYETFEYEISAFEECGCGAKSCRLSLGGFKKHGKDLEEKYGLYIANYLKQSI